MKRIALFLPLIFTFLLPTAVRAQTHELVTTGIVSRAPVNRVADAGFRHGRTIGFPNGLAITLSSYEPVTGLTQFPGGPPLRPHRGYRFVITSWLIRNTTHYTVRLGIWVARSQGMNSPGFVTGNAANFGTLPAGGSVSQTWLFEVAKSGRVAIYYDRYPDSWLPRGR
jgi:hypothetical protein